MRIQSIVVPIAIMALAGCELAPGSSWGSANSSGPYPGSDRVGSSYCYENPIICGLVGVVVIGGVYHLIRDSGDGYTSSMTSDATLKHNVQYVQTLENGIRLHAFQYIGDDRTFVGVLAHELLADDRFSHAVSRGAHGYYEVDYGQLGLGLTGAEAMQEASEIALETAASL